MSSVKKLAVIGAGQMGGGIAQVAASIAKIPSVLLFDVQQHQLEHRMAFIGTLSITYCVYLISRVHLEQGCW